MVVFVTLRMPKELSIAGPNAPLDPLPLITLLITFTVASPVEIPPPFRFPVMVQLEIVMTNWLEVAALPMPRPKPLTTQSESDRLPALLIPKLLVGSAPCTVTPEMDACAVAVMKNIMKFEPPRKIVSTAEPGPLIFMSEVMFGKTVCTLIVPASPVRLIVSELELLPAAHSPATAPDAVLVFAAVIASRNVH